MADIIDQAQQQEAQNIAHALFLQGQRARAEARPAAAGHCLNHECGEPFDTGTERLFCGPACAQRYDTVKRLKHQ